MQRWCRPFSAWSTVTSLMRSFTMAHGQGISSNMPGTVESEGACIQQDATRIKHLDWAVTYLARNLDITSKTKTGGRKVWVVENNQPKVP